MSLNFHTYVNVLTKFMNGIAGLLEFWLFLVHGKCEYGLSFTGKPANERKMFPRISTLTKPVNEG